MRKEAVGIPIVLWICAAAWLHTVAGGGGYQLAVLHDDANFLSSFSDRVRDRVRESEQVVEIDFGSADPSPAPEDEPTPPPEAIQPPQKQKERPKDEPKKEPPPKEPEKKQPEKKDVVPVPVAPATPPPPPPKDQRIAVRQHVRPDQEDNKEAKFIADEANKVDQETVATQTSTDQDDEKPAPGGNHAGPSDEIGNAEKTKVASAQEHAGEKNRAPGERATHFDFEPPSQPAPKPDPRAARSTPPPAGGDGRTAATPARAPKVEEPSPNPPPGEQVQNAPNSGWSFNPFSGSATGSVAQSAQGKTGQRSEAPDKPSSTKWLGLGGKPGPGELNLNLNHNSVVAVVGEDKLRKERAADGERRLTAHRGSWRSSNLDRWRSAIENYVTSVKPGNQTSLNAARVPFATYLNGIHNRIHPIFAESFLDSLANLPATHPLNNRKMHTNLEIVLTREGKIVKMGITHTSGVTAFDIAALDSVERASPFGPAPAAILSTDGNVYLHWEFHRDEVFACSTANARPFMLNVPSKGAEPGLPPAGPAPAEGEPPSGARHGANEHGRSAF